MRVSISSQIPVGNGTGWKQFLEPGETLLWTGRPAYGRRVFEFIGAEKTWQLGLLLGTVAMWLTWPMIERDGARTADDAIWGYGAATLAFGLVAIYMATARAYVLGTLHYAVTDRRAIVRREGRNHFLANREFLVSCEHSQGFRFPIVPGLPYPSLTVGYLLSRDEVQPFGYGLTHPGWHPLRARGVVPILFEQLENAGDVRDLLAATTSGAAHAGGSLAQGAAD